MSGKNKRAIVLGASGRPHRVYLIRGHRVVKEKDTDAYLREGWGATALGHWDGKFHFK